MRETAVQHRKGPKAKTSNPQISDFWFSGLERKFLSPSAAKSGLCLEARYWAGLFNYLVGTRPHSTAGLLNSLSKVQGAEEALSV